MRLASKHSRMCGVEGAKHQKAWFFSTGVFTCTHNRKILPKSFLALMGDNFNFPLRDKSQRKWNVKRMDSCAECAECFVTVLDHGFWHSEATKAAFENKIVMHWSPVAGSCNTISTKLTLSHTSIRYWNSSFSLNAHYLRTANNKIRIIRFIVAVS